MSLKNILLDYFHIIKCATCNKWSKYFSDRRVDYSRFHPECYLCKQCQNQPTNQEEWQPLIQDLEDTLEAGKTLCNDTESRLDKILNARHTNSL